MIFATLGTMYLDFPRLIHALDDIAASTGEEVIIQTGMGTTFPAHAQHFDFKSRDEILELQSRARIIICHAGIGAIIDALKAEKPLIVVPRLKRHNEHNSDHQLELAGAVERRTWGRTITNINELAAACTSPPDAYTRYAPAKAGLIAAVRETIEKAVAG